MSDFQSEWAIIHRDIEKYESFSLIIKLFSVLISTSTYIYHVDIRFTIALILILWLQDAIWKTFQKRLETRIIFIEKMLQLENSDSYSSNTNITNNSAYQLYSQWDGQRQGIAGLVKEYLVNSLKPTVAYPYALLALLILII